MSLSRTYWCMPAANAKTVRKKAQKCKEPTVRNVREPHMKCEGMWDIKIINYEIMNE